MENIKSAVENYKELMVKAERDIWNNPEVGYKEFKTNEYMLAEFKKLGYETERFDGITGFTAYYDTGKKGPTVLALAELDALYCSNHPECNEKGVVHCCGHNVQCASILGVAGAIKDIAQKEGICGKIKFALVPAEEGIELSYRNELIEKGVIKFTSGKAECISRGMLKDVDLAFMVHTTNTLDTGASYRFGVGSNGVVRKKTVIKGKAAHAGAYPQNGINALFAAELVLSATNALRETFVEQDYIRFHSIITKGGDSVNTVPEEVIIESYVRGANPKAIISANKKLNRAITGACLAMNAKVRIIDRAGSEPLLDDANMTKLMIDVGEKLAGEGKCAYSTKWEPSSTDMGDVSCLVPSVHAYVGGISGISHGKDYRVIDPEKICVDSASLQVGTLAELLKDGAKKAYEIMEKFTPTYNTLEDYLTQKFALSQDIECITYDGEKAIINS